MCGRFTQSYSWKEVHDFLNLIGEPLNLEPRYNIAPTQDAQIVRADSDGKHRLSTLHWGFVPSWSKGPDSRFSMINARAETVATKPAFRSAFRQRRCLVPADGFYEWRAQKDGKQPYLVGMEGDGLFAMAGLWEHWKGPGEEIESFTIIVTDANELLEGIHDRMPVILHPEHFETWLDPEMTDGKFLEPLLEPYPAKERFAYPVSRRVNSPRNDDQTLIEAIADA